MTDKNDIYNVMEKLISPFEKLENLLADTNPLTKQQYLSRVLVSALSSPDPVALLNTQVKLYSKLKGVDKMIYYFAKDNNITISLAKDQL